VACDRSLPVNYNCARLLHFLQVGDAIEVKGPMGKFVYEGRGQYQLNRQSGQAKYMSMIAGGSGITPCYAVLRKILADPEDRTRCALIYANKHEEDIWVRKVGVSQWTALVQAVGSGV
jgi:nitrate reductase (NAD(P)H)